MCASLDTRSCQQGSAGLWPSQRSQRVTALQGEVRAGQYAGPLLLLLSWSWWQAGSKTQQDSQSWSHPAGSGWDLAHTWLVGWDQSPMLKASGEKTPECYSSMRQASSDNLWWNNLCALFLVDRPYKLLGLGCDLEEDAFLLVWDGRKCPICMWEDFRCLSQYSQ